MHFRGLVLRGGKESRSIVGVRDVSLCPSASPPSIPETLGSYSPVHRKSNLPVFHSISLSMFQSVPSLVYFEVYCFE